MRILFQLVMMISICAFYGCATSITTMKQGQVNAALDKAVQDSKDALNTYKFDLQTIDTSSKPARLTGKRTTGQEAWVTIDPGTGSTCALKVKVNKEGEKEVGADVIFDDIKARSQR